MSNLLDLNPILNKNQSKAWVEKVFYLAEHAPTPQERLNWQEIKLALQFDLYFAETGSRHPHDPALLDETGAYLNEDT